MVKKPNLIKLITTNHKKTKRNYLKRMVNKKVKSMVTSKKYSFDYWDGSRSYGYGGYEYDGRWKNVAKKIIKKYKLNKNSKILDLGCGKGHLVYELFNILKSDNIFGIDISNYAIKNSPIEIRNKLKRFDLRKNFSYRKNQFDLVISINLIHNFNIYQVFRFLKNITKISKKSFVSTESYRNNQELFNLQCWALTADSFFSPEEWRWIFMQCGYYRDYELIYFS